jgi:predicted dehydrogenase
MLRIVQIGVGMRGRTWARLVQQHPDLVAAAYVDVNLDDLRRWLSSCGDSATPCYTNLEQALGETRPDVLLVATPPDVHFEQVMAGLRWGLPVLVEKPLTETLPQAIALVREAEQRQILLAVGMNFRYVPAHRLIRDIITGEQLGYPSFAQFTYLRHRDGRRADLNQYAMTTAQPMLVEQSIHHFDLMRFCYGREVESVVADAWNPPWSTYADDANASVLLRFEGNLFVNYIGTYAAGWNKFDFRWRTDCSGGVLIQNDQFGDLQLARFVPDMGLNGERFKHTAEPLLPIAPPAADNFIENTRLLLADFVRSVQAGEPLLCEAKDHIKTLALSLACVEAAASGRRVVLDDFYRLHGVPSEWV